MTLLSLVFLSSICFTLLGVLFFIIRIIDKLHEILIVLSKSHNMFASEADTKLQVPLKKQTITQGLEEKKANKEFKKQQEKEEIFRKVMEEGVATKAQIDKLGEELGLY